METSMHRELKQLYAGPDAQTEVRHGRYRIDAVVAGELIEIQHGPLGAIRAKISDLLSDNDVRIVKPIVREKLLITRRRKGKGIVSRRRSPKHGHWLDLFHDLVYFTKVFPHPRLSIELLLVDIEEYRYPGHGRRRRWRRNDFQVEDQHLVAVGERCLLRTPGDLVRLLACSLPLEFHTGDLARALDLARFTAQRIAYCLRETGAARVLRRQRAGVIYQLVESGAQERAHAA